MSVHRVTNMAYLIQSNSVVTELIICSVWLLLDLLRCAVNNVLEMLALWDNMGK